MEWEFKKKSSWSRHETIKKFDFNFLINCCRFEKILQNLFFNFFVALLCSVLFNTPIRCFFLSHSSFLSLLLFNINESNNIINNNKGEYQKQSEEEENKEWRRLTWWGDHEVIAVHDFYYFYAVFLLVHLSHFREHSINFIITI